MFEFFINAVNGKLHLFYSNSRFDRYSFSIDHFKIKIIFKKYRKQEISWNFVFSFYIVICVRRVRRVRRVVIFRRVIRHLIPEPFECIGAFQFLCFRYQLHSK